MPQMTAYFLPHAQRGGVWQYSGSRCGEADFLYLSHSAVVIHCEPARQCRTGKKGRDESDPPQKRGGM